MFNMGHKMAIYNDFYNKRPKWFGKGCTEWQTDWQTDGQTDTAINGNNNLHLMHSMPPRKATVLLIFDTVYSCSTATNANSNCKDVTVPFIFSALYMLKPNLWQHSLGQIHLWSINSVADTSRESYMRKLACGIRRHQNWRIGPSLRRDGWKLKII